MGKKARKRPAKAQKAQKQKAQPARSSERAKKPAGFHAEGEASAEDAEESIADRAFWERWDTGLLAAWELDFPADPALPALSPMQATHRESVIDALVQRKRARPKEGDELAQLQLIWRKHMGAPESAAAPGPAKAAPASDPPAASSSPEGHRAPIAEAKGEEEHSEEEGDRESEEDEPPPSKRPRTDAIDLTSEGQKQQLMQFSGTDETGNTTRITFRHPLQHCCTCALTRPPAADALPHTAQAWRCACGRRGDLPFDHEINREIMSTRAGLSAPGSASTTSAASSSGTNPTNPDSSLSKRDRHFKLLLARVCPPQTAFSFSPALGASPHGPAHSIVENMKAHQAAENDPPSAHLIALIRAGKLTEVGFALPRPLNEAPDDERNAQVGFVITDRGTWAETSSGTTAPPVPSAQAFCMALFSTILPALVDMPAALSQWFALGRTALQLERTRGWQAADGYVRQVLNQCRNLGVDMAPTNMSCLLNTFAESAPGGGGAAPQHRPQHSPQQSRAEQRTCHQWNFGNCTYPNCRHRHVCSGCGANHKGSSCLQGQAEEARRVARRTAEGRSDSGSVRTAPASGSGRSRKGSAPAAAPAAGASSSTN